MSRGNPEFGKKFKEPTKEETPYDAQIKINIHEATKKKFQQLAQEKNCTVTDIARKALYEYLAQQEKITA